MTRPAKTSSRAKLALLVFSILFAILIAEIATRAVETRDDDPRGWSRSEPMQFVHDVRDTPDVIRTVNVTYVEHGFRRWPDSRTDQKRVLIIGDSFTEMVFVNASEAWYATLEREYPGTAFYVYGVGGYGSTQEAMAVLEYADVIKPDAIIWQTYFNDYSNSYWPADRQEYPLNNLQVRPYLEDGKLVYRYPMPLGRLRRHSALAREILPLYDRVAHDRALTLGDTFWHRVYGERFWERDFALSRVWGGRFEEAERATNDSFAMVRAKLPDTPIYVLSADDRLRASEERVAASNGNIYIGGVPSMLEAHQAAGEIVTVTGDRHWNRRGNEIVGAFLAGYFENTTALGGRQRGAVTVSR